MNQSEEKELKKAREINAELVAGLETGAGKYKQLRELNSELLAELQFVVHLSEEESLDYFDEDRTRRLVEKARKINGLWKAGRAEL